MKSSIVIGLTRGIIGLGYAATGYIASTILWIAFVISSAPALFLRLLLAIACACHIIQLFTLPSSDYNQNNNHYHSTPKHKITQKCSKLTSQAPQNLKTFALIPNVTSLKDIT